MVLRYVSVVHSASIAQNLLLNLTPPAGGDIRGNPRYLAGVHVTAGDDTIRVHVSSPDWGPRVYDSPPMGVGGAIDGLGQDNPFHLMKVSNNQEVNVACQQDSLGAQTVSVRLTYLEGTLPAQLAGMVGELTTLFFEGFASAAPGFGSVPGATVRLQVEANSTWWPIAISGVGGGSANSAAITYPEADGQGPIAPIQSDVLQQTGWTAVPPLKPVKNGDNVDMSVDDGGAGLAFDAIVLLIRSDGGAMPERYDIKYGVAA